MCFIMKNTVFIENIHKMFFQFSYIISIFWIKLCSLFVYVWKHFCSSCIKMTSQKYEKMTRGEIDNMHTKIITDITVFVQLCHVLFFICMSMQKSDFLHVIHFNMFLDVILSIIHNAYILWKLQNVKFGSNMVTHTAHDFKTYITQY